MSSFPIGLVKTESELSDHKAMVIVNPYPFKAFSDLTFQGAAIGVFLVELTYVIIRTPNLEVATKRLLHQQFLCLLE